MKLPSILLVKIPITTGGEAWIRPHGTVSRSQHFQCCQFNHSCTSPRKAEGGRMRDEAQTSWSSYSSFVAYSSAVNSNCSIAYPNEARHVSAPKRLRGDSFNLAVRLTFGV